MSRSCARPNTPKPGKHALNPPSSTNTNRKLLLIRAAARLFAEQGFVEPNLRQIAQQAEMSPGTLHYYFPSKDELIKTLVMTAAGPIARQAEEIAEAPGPAAERLKQIIEQSFQLFDDDWDLYCVALMLGDAVQERLATRFPTATRAFQKVIEQGQAAGEMRGGDPQLLAIQCHGVVMRTARARVFNELTPPLRQYADAVVDSVFRILEVHPLHT